MRGVYPAVTYNGHYSGPFERHVDNEEYRPPAA